MAHFYGTLNGSKGEATRCGTVNSGLETIAASYSGAVKVEVFKDEKTGMDYFEVKQIKWQGAGVEEVIAKGPLGLKTSNL